mmetsp:Transcript_987/g.3312  ORF Transcript_987/g.3312 Transcript_987/m.3312 type:complete len:232 (-) Transcript_987:511-1206(-)
MYCSAVNAASLAFARLSADSRVQSNLAAFTFKTQGSKLERRVLFSSAAFCAESRGGPPHAPSSLMDRKAFPMRCLSAAMVTPTLANRPLSARACAKERQSKAPMKRRSSNASGTSTVASQPSLFFQVTVLGLFCAPDRKRLHGRSLRLPSSSRMAFKIAIMQDVCSSPGKRSTKAPAPTGLKTIATAPPRPARNMTSMVKPTCTAMSALKRDRVSLGGGCRRTEPEDVRAA